LLCSLTETILPSVGIVSSPPVSPLEKQHILGNIFAIRAYVAELRGDFNLAIGLARAALENLPEDWICPVCGVGKEFFEEVK